MGILLLMLLAALAGYVGSIMSWPRLRQALIGVENEIDDLRTRARALEARLRG